MKVVCIEDSYATEHGMSCAKKGNIYTVLDSKRVTKQTENGMPIEQGLYFSFAEINHWHHNSLFVEINDNQQDETEMERNYNLQTILP